MLNIYLLRHGETSWNADGNRYCGRTDISLTEKGIRQASCVNDQLKELKFDAVYSSPLERAWQTASIAAAQEPVKDERLIEVDFGAWEGKTREEFIREDPSLWANWISNPAWFRAGGNGETGLEVVTRVDAFFTELREKFPAANIMVVGHNGINRLYMAWKLGMELKNYQKIVQENSSVTLFTLDFDGAFTLRQTLNMGNNALFATDPTDTYRHPSPLSAQILSLNINDCLLASKWPSYNHR
jgi:broad specificity phosphatase PhoE